MTLTDTLPSTLADLFDEYATLKYQYDPILTRINTLEETIKAQVKETGETCPGIVIGKTYQRINWQTDQLVALSAQLPQILDCKTVTAVTPIRLDWKLVTGG